ncbi:MAG: 50S ribosomal protein L20 [Oligoflexales bacterium]
MTRAKRGFKARRRRNRLLGLAKGYRQTRGNCYRSAVTVVRKGLTYAFRDRRAKKRHFRSLWITRINAAVREQGMRYSDFICALKKLSINLDRSALADLAVNDPAMFNAIVAKAKTAV